jgi:hypothetical protein
MKNTLTLFACVVMLSGCFRLDDAPNPLASLYAQRISNSRLIIYDYAFQGAYSFTTGPEGFGLLDSGRTFSRKDIQRLPGQYFIVPPTASSLKMMSIGAGSNPITSKDTLLTAFRKYRETVAGLLIEMEEYRETYGSALCTSLAQYRFDGIKETKDSLILYNIVKISGYTALSVTTSFPKGNISVIDSGTDDIDRIEIRRAIISRGEVYEPPHPLVKVTGQPIVGMADYYFFPAQKTKTSVLSDYGIFKRVKSSPHASPW